MSLRPFGYFVHHQGRGHIERCRAIVEALPEARPVRVFCARPEEIGIERRGVEVVGIPSLFEPTGQERRADWIETPDTLHCAPVGWPGIREAMGVMATWFLEADPALMISDVSAEVAQLARLCSVPHVKVLQHGDRSDAGHQAAYTGAAGLIVPCDAALAQPDWTDAMRGKAVFAGGLGAEIELPDKWTAKRRIGANPDRPVVLVLSGGGGEGLAAAPLAVGARATPSADWITVGRIARDWHATEPDNLQHRGWVDNVRDFIAAADLIVSSTGNTTCQQVLAAGCPWLVVPEWRYFDEQIAKAAALARAGVALHLPSMPASALAWRTAIARVRERHDPDRQRAMVRADAADHVAAWLERLATHLNSSQIHSLQEIEMLKDAQPDISVLTIARGRAAHLRNFILGLKAQSVQPRELIVGVMQEDAYTDLPDVDFPIRQVHIIDDELPLARARNTVATVSRGDVLVFLDVDCIAHPHLLMDYGREARSGEGVMMGEILYLPAAAAADGWSFDRFDAVGVRHSDRQAPPAEGRRLCEDYRCFWSLTFAVHRDDWRKSGGFDDRFKGYGGEDTDFGKSLSTNGIPIWWVAGARAYHQFHDHCMPPIHHIESIIRNSELFAQKWGYRTMEHWLHGFRMMGLIENGPDGLRVRRKPNAEDMALCAQKPDMPYAATAPVIRHLEDRERAAQGLAPVVDVAVRHVSMTAAQNELLTPGPHVAAE